MLPRFPVHSQPPAPEDLDSLLRRPLAAYQPLPVRSGLDPDREPESGGLAWLLARRMPARDLAGGTVRMQTAEGLIADPGLEQAWAHARQFYGRHGADDPPPRSEPKPFPGFAWAGARLRDDTPRLPPRDAGGLLTRLYPALITRLMVALGVRLPEAGAPEEKRQAFARQVQLVAYLLDWPPGRDFQARYGPYDAAQAAALSPAEVFGHSGSEVAGMLRNLLLDALGREQGVFRAIGTPSDELALAGRAAGDFFHACLARLQQADRRDGAGTGASASKAASRRG